MPGTEHEEARIRRVYTAYAENGHGESKWSLENPGNVAINLERSRALGKMLGKSGFKPLADERILEVGCGGGRVIEELIGLGACPRLLAGVDLRPEGIESAQSRWPEADLRVADAQQLPFVTESLDLVIVFTVFSSILDGEVAKRVADEICRVVKPGGGVVYYDFQYNNPWNPEVRGIKRSGVETLFTGFRGNWTSLTLLPPLARRLGPLTPLAYPALAAIAPLRTHLLGVLIKPPQFARRAS